MWKSAEKQRLFTPRKYPKTQSNRLAIIKKGNANDNKLSKGNTFGGI